MGKQILDAKKSFASNETKKLREWNENFGSCQNPLNRRFTRSVRIHHLIYKIKVCLHIESLPTINQRCSIASLEESGKQTEKSLTSPNSIARHMAVSVALCENSL